MDRTSTETAVLKTSTQTQPWKGNRAQRRRPLVLYDRMILTRAQARRPLRRVPSLSNTGNYFRNLDQKTMEVVGTYTFGRPDPQRKSEYILIEDNEFALGSGPNQAFAGIQYAGNNSIVRRSVFHHCGFGVDLTSWEDADASYADALYFSDGKGLVDPDVIRGGGVQEMIVHADYANNEIEVSQSLSWGDDAPVTPDYSGSAPDMGAYEYSGGPQPPVAD